MFVNNKLKIFIVFSLIFVFLFFLVLFIFPYQNFLPSPDENANYIFSNHFSRNNSLILKVNNSNSEIYNLLKPRSITFRPSIGGYSNSSFYGLPVIMGFVSKVIPAKMIIALIALSASWILYQILSKFISNLTTRLLLVILFVTNPIFLLYAVRGYMHNMLFLLFFLISVLFIISISKKDPEKKMFLYSLYSGISFGFALWVRTSEIVWFLGIIVFLMWFYYPIQIKKILLNIFIFVVSAFLIFIPSLITSFTLAKSFIQYRSFNIEIATQSNSLYALVKHYIFPFGFDLTGSFTNFWYFALEIWWLSIPSFFLIIIWIINLIINKKKRVLILTTCILLTIVYFILVYGAYERELPNSEINIGISHFRYWLPLFSLMPVTFIIFFNYIKSNRLLYFGYFIICLLSLTSLVYIFNTNSGLKDLRFYNIMSKQRSEFISKQIESNSIILAGLADKYFFPRYLVAGTIMHEKREWFVASLISNSIIQPVYYYHVDADISSHFTKKALEDAGVTFTYVTQFWDGGNAWEYLYKLDWPNKIPNNNEEQNQ